MGAPKGQRRGSGAQSTVQGAGTSPAGERRRSESYLRAMLFEHTFQFIGLLAPDGTLLDLNRSALEFAGARREDVVGRPFWETPWWQGDPELQERLRNAIREAAQGRFARFEASHLGTGGRTATIDFSLTPVVDESGGVILLVPEGRDITERKRAEEALRSLYESTPVMMHSIDRDGRLVSVSDCWLETLGYDRAEVIGRESVEFLTPESRRYALEVALPEFFRTGVCRDVPYQFVKKDRDVIDVLLSAIAEKDAGGRFERSLSVLINVTRRKRAEEALREADRRKTEFLGVLSHELRNPLAPIQNALYILDRAEPGGEQAARAKVVIGRQVGHLARLVDDLLDVTRISRGKIQLQRSRLDLGKLVLRTVEDYRALFAERGIALEVRIDTGPLWVDADETRIAQVLGNLLLNSAKFTDGGGRVVVSVERDEDVATISVRDTGAGIAPEMLGRLFEPFTQADDSLHRSRGGLGLGLSLVKGLVELHGGSAVARSEGVGRGAELIVRLRLVAAREEAPRPPIIGPARLPPRRVLVIEDNPDAATTLREMLEIGGHEAEITHDGRAGIEKARAFRPEIILCDIGLPDMDGYAVARAIRSDPTLDLTLLVALTGYALPEDRRQAAEAGFDRHFAKPVSVAQIEEVLSTAVRAGGARSDQRARGSGVE
ncbi:MAG TPA: PAS domain S-box protein [Anaeromyxobacter sp.]